MSLGDDLAEVLSIQADRTSDPKDPMMQRRKELVERVIPRELERILREVNPEWKAEGSGGKGTPAEVPWTRFFDPELSTKAGVGWYAVFLFSASGEAVYLSLNQGTTTWSPEKKDFIFRSDSDLQARAQSARKLLTWAGLQSVFDDLDLNAKQKLGRAYQVGNVHAYRYRSFAMFETVALDLDIAHIAEMLELLYECELRGVDFGDPEALTESDVPQRTVQQQRSSLAGSEGAISATVEVRMVAGGEISLTRTVVLPSVTDDDVDGPDMLDIDADARALATVIAAKQVVPPLAIALYGEWGSGKSYFMHSVERHIKQFGASDRAGQVFQPGTAHIRFKAWHYERGHLMASLHQQIFEALDVKGPRFERERTAANQTITELQDEIKTIGGEVEAAQKKRKGIQDKIDEVRSEQDDENELLKSVTIQDIVNDARSNPEVRKWLDQTMKDLGLHDLQDSVLKLLGTAREVDALKERIKFLGKPGRWGWWSSPLMGAALATLIVLAVTVGLGYWAAGPIRAMGTSIGVVASLATGMATAVGKQIRLVRKVIQPAEDLQSLVEQRLETKRAQDQAEIEKLQTKLTTADQAVAEVEKKKAAKEGELDKAERQRDDLKPGSILKRFIAERAATAEYDEHLGVVTRIHRDLHELSECLKDALEDEASPFKRVVLYIDDLDRCAAPTVMAVLEAVHLFLALPQFVVIVGVDHRSLENSLRGAHGELLSAEANALAPSDYLEKIFQLTYTLPPMTPDGCRAVLRDAIKRRPARIELEISSATTEPDSEPVPGEAVEGAGSPSDSPAEQATGTDPVARSNEQDSSPVDQYVISSLDITDDDCEVLDQLAVLVATTPRRAKRFLTIYIVVRARLARLDYNAAAVALLVAALVGAPNTLGRALRKVDEVSVPTRTFGGWVTESIGTERFPAELARVATFLENAGILLELPLEDVIAHRREVVRYTIGITHDTPEVLTESAGKSTIIAASAITNGHLQSGDQS
ncbi:MrcB family domain-containing protein [Nocardia heshunensis]